MSDHTVAIVHSAGRVLLMRQLGHRGLYHIFPGGRARSGEGLDVACARTAIDAIQAAVGELASQLGSDDLVDKNAYISILREIASHPWSGGIYHYFLATLNGKSPIFDATFQPHIDPHRHQLGVWMPYEWIACDGLSSINLQPDQAIGICRQLFGIQ